MKFPRVLWMMVAAVLAVGAIWLAQRRTSKPSTPLLMAPASSPAPTPASVPPVAPAAATPELKPARAEVPNVDRRSLTGGASLAPSLEAGRAARRNAAAQLMAAMPGVRVDFDDLLVSPKYIGSTRGFLASLGGGPVSSADAQQLVKDFVDGRTALFGHTSAALTGAELLRDYETAHNGMRTLVWQQRINGIRVFESTLQASVTKNGELVSVSSHLVPDPATAAKRGSALPASPVIDAKTAISKAAEGVGHTVPAVQIVASGPAEGATQKQVFRAASLLDVSTQYAWVPLDETNLRLSWEVLFMSKQRGEMFRTLVDAETGETLVRQRLTEYISPASYRVFTSDSPTPMSPGLPTPASSQPQEVARTPVTLEALDTRASPNGWIDDGVNETRGNNVDAHLDLNADNLADTPRPQGSPNRVFYFPLDLSQAPSAYRDAAVTNLFYWNNYIHDRYYQLGFTEAAGNFQNDNFNRGGVGNDAVQADAQDGSGTNNANFSTPPDGSAGRMQMYVFTGPTPDRDGDFDQEIVIHEYTHGLSNRLVGGGVGISNLQPRGMGEGWSDFYGLCLLSTPADDPHAPYASGAYASYQLSGLTQNYYFGIRRYPYCTDLSKNPLTFKDIDPTLASAHTGTPRNPVVGTTANEVHNMGEVWGVTLWDVRANLIAKLGAAAGNEMVLRLVTDGMKLAPANPNFLQARDGILQADLVNNSGANRGELWSAFAKRGMGSGASSPASTTTAGLVENYDVPDDLGVAPPTAWTVTRPTGGPFSQTNVYTLVNSGTATMTWTATRTQPWLALSSSGGTLAPGGTTTVTASFTPSADTLNVGSYADTITFRNVNSGLSQQRAVALIVEPITIPIIAENWESGTAGSAWSITGTNTHRTLVTTANGPHGGSYHLTMDSSADGTYARNEATWTVNLAGRTGVQLRFWVNMFNEEPDGPPDSPFTTAADFDGVAISADGGNTWYEVQPLRTYANVYTRYVVDLDAALAARGVTYNSNFKIRFNHYDNFTLPTDGFAFDDIELVETVNRRLTLTLPATASESAGAVNATLLVLPASSTDLVVDLTSSDISEATVPATVTVPAGQTSVVLPIALLDDTLLDGTQSVTLTAVAATYADGTAVLGVTDDESATLSLSIPNSTQEGSSDLIGTVSMSAPADSDITVALASSQPADLQVPASVQIQAGQTSAIFILNPIDDTRIDGAVITTVSAQVANWTGATANISVLDNETSALSVTLPATAREGDAPITGSVRLSGTLTTALTASLSSSDTTELTVPATVVIPAGQLSANFTATVLNDTAADGAQNATVTASAAGFASGTGTISIRDNDAHHFTFNMIAGPQVPNVAFSVTVSARDVNDTIITNYNSSPALTGSGSGSPVAVTPATLTGWVNGVWTGNVTVGLAATNVVLTANDGAGHTGSSNAFNVAVGTLHHFAWNTIPSPQTRDNFFSATVLAKDAGNNTVTSFSGNAALSAEVPVSTDLDIGTGISTWDYPMHTGYHDSRTTSIYLASELGGARRIASVSLYVGVLPGQVMNAWTIRMKHTALATFSSPLWEGTGWTTVYQSNQTVSTTGWVTFQLTTRFDYDGTNNLMVDFSHNNSSFTTSGLTRSTPTAAVRTMYFYADSFYGDPLTWSGPNVPAFATANRPNLRLGVEATGPTIPLTPSTSGDFAGGVWTGQVAVPVTASGVKLVAQQAAVSGKSNSFDVQLPTPPPSGGSAVFSETFESGTLSPSWTLTGTNTYRTQVTTGNLPHGGTRHLTMDSSADESYARNEATLTVNLAGRTGVVLSFWAKGFGDEPNGPPPSPFTGGADFDGVAISADGTSWYEVQALRTLAGSYTQFTVNLDTAIAARGLSYNSNFKIRFNQYDNYTISTDGIAIDDILITANPISVLTVTVPAQATEGAGIMSGMVTLPSAAGTDTTVTLVSNANAKVSVQPSVVVPAGQSSASFSFNVLDNPTVDGNRDVAIIASLASGTTGAGTITVLDNDVTTLLLTMPTSTTEGATGVTATATLGAAPASPITFNAISSDTTEIAVPATVTIPAGQSSIIFPLTVVNDTAIDGPQNATVTLSAAGWTNASKTITVLDNETTALSLNFATTVNEGSSITGTVSLSGTLPTSTVVSLSSNNPGQLSVPATVTIAANSISASFTLTGVEDAQFDGTQSATVTASASAFTNATRNISVLDNDVHHLAWAAITGPKSAGVAFAVTITAQDINNVTVPAFSGTATLAGTGAGGAVVVNPTSTGAFASGAWTGNVALNTVAANVQLTATAGTASGVSKAFDVIVPPTIAVSPGSLALTLNQGDSATRTLTIQNTGTGTLIWSAANSSSLAGAIKAVENPAKTPTLAPVEANDAPDFLDLAHLRGPQQDSLNASATSLSLPAALANLNSNYDTIRNAIPNRYSFTEGVTGSSISDGGGDMYDTGNMLGTNLGSSLTYSDNLIVSSAVLGSGGQYFTRKFDGLWIFAADINGLSYFEITGGLGADGSGATDTAILTLARGSTTYRGLVKRVYSTSDPSVNHLIIVENNGSATHEASTDTNNDYHRLTNLTGVTRIYHVLYAGTSGAYINDPSAQAIMSAFLDAIGTPDWVIPNPTSGSVAGGTSQNVTLTIDATNLPSGTYNRTLVLTSNDPFSPTVNIPVAITVTGQANLAVTPATGLTSSGLRGGPFTPASQAFTLTNTGGAAVAWSVSKTATWIDLSSTSGTLNPGASTRVAASLNAAAGNLASGSFSDVLTFTNTTNGNGNTTRPVALTVQPFGELSITPPTNLDATGPFGGPFSPAVQAYTLTNSGDAPIDWTVSKTAAWLSLSSTGGTLAAGGSTTVTATIDGTTLELGNYGDTLTFTNTTNGRGNGARGVTLAVILPAPTLAPEPSVTAGTSNRVSWNAVTGAGFYEVQLATDAGFTNAVSSGPVTGLSYTFGGLTDGQTYHYRVRAQGTLPGPSSSWTQSTSAEFAAGTLSNVSTSAVPGSVVLSSSGPLAADFDEPGTSWSSTIFPDAPTGTFTRGVLTAGPSSTAPLPVKQNSDLAVRTGSSGITAHALATDVTANRFTNGSIEAWIAPENRSSLSHGGLMLRASRGTSGVNGYAAILLFYADGTGKADFSRVTNGAHATLSTWFYSNTSSYSVGDNDNIRALFSVNGSTLSLSLWRVVGSGSLTVQTPILFYSGTNTLTAIDTTYPASGVAGLLRYTAGSTAVLYDDVNITGLAANYLPAGTLITGTIPVTSLIKWKTLDYHGDTTAPGTALTVDVLDAAGNLLAAGLAGGADLNAIPPVASVSAIKLRANLSSANNANTPRLDDWSLTWQSGNDVAMVSNWSNAVSSTQDATIPIVEVTSAASSAGPAHTLTGTASALPGVASIVVNGHPAQTSDGYAHWSLPAALVNGANVFNIVATSASVPPKTTTLTWTVTAAISDFDGDGLPDAWETLHGLSGADNSGRNGAFGDFDGDGIANIWEYLAGLDPKTDEGIPAYWTTLETKPEDGRQYLIFHYRRPLMLFGWTVGLQGSDDLISWNSDPILFEEAAPPSPVPGSDVFVFHQRLLQPTGDSGVSAAFVRMEAIPPAGVLPAQASAKSEPVGFVTLSITPGYNAVGPTLVNAPLFRSQVAGATGSAITFAPGNPPVNLGSRLRAGTRYYVEVVKPNASAATYVGDVLEVDVPATIASGDNALTVKAADFNTLTGPLPDLSGYSAVVRPHVTIGQLFGSLGSPILNGAADANSADQVLFYDRSTGKFTPYWFRAHAAATIGEWRSLDASDSADYTNRPIPPGAGVFVKRQVGNPGMKIVVLGGVRTNDLRQPLVKGFNLVAQGLPSVHSPAMLGMNGIGGFQGGSNALPADKMLFLDPLTGSYSTYWLRDSGTIEEWRALDLSITTNFMENTSFFDGAKAIFLFKTTDDPDRFVPISALDLAQ